jgi:hypothetical protein
VLRCALQETDEERGRRIASQWTNDPAAAGSAVRAQDATRPQQQQRAAQPQHAQPTTHTAVEPADVVTAASTNTSSAAAGQSVSKGTSDRGIARGSSEHVAEGSLSSTADNSGQELAAGRHTAAAAAGVVVAQRAYVMVWAVLLVGCVALGGRRLLARTQR